MSRLMLFTAPGATEYVLDIAEPVLARVSVPLLTVVPPVRLLTPSSVSKPEPVMVRPPVSMELTFSSVPLVAVSVTLLLPRLPMLWPCIFSVPPSRMIAPLGSAHQWTGDIDGDIAVDVCGAAFDVEGAVAVGGGCGENAGQKIAAAGTGGLLTMRAPVLERLQRLT